MEIKLISLLKQQRAYWKQRGQIKWVTLGDASTKFFHADATVKFRGNFITQLRDEQGTIVTEHSDKANLIWQAFKERLGSSDYMNTSYDLASHFVNPPDLSSLVQPFSKQEIDSVV